MGFQDAIIACQDVKKGMESLLEDVGSLGSQSNSESTLFNENFKKRLRLFFQSLHRITEVLGSHQHVTGESSTTNGSATTTIIKSEPNDTGYESPVDSMNFTNGKRAYAELSPDEISPIKQLDSSTDDVIAGNFPKRQRNLSFNSDETLQSEKFRAKFRLLQCAHCDYATSYPDRLVRHTYTHTDDKPYKCEICTNKFTKKKSYKWHMQRQHSIKFPFECSICGEGFENVGELQRHATRSKSYYCVECKKSFQHHKYNYEKHMRSHGKRLA